MTIDGNSCAVSGDLGLWQRFALKPKPSILRRVFENKTTTTTKTTATNFPCQILQLKNNIN